MRQGHALSADFTGIGWHQRLGYSDTPVRTPREAGTTLAGLACAQDFSVFDGWLTDYAGHGGDMQASRAVLQVLDTVVGELLAAGDKDGLLTVITSDHGNLEDLRERGHTSNPVPTLLVGPRQLREAVAGHMADLTGLAPAVREILL